MAIKQFFFKMKGGGTQAPIKPFSKIAWSWLGAFIGIYLVSIMGKLTNYDLLNNLFLIGSFGASAVLIYGAPQADFSQPKNLLGGHIFSAIIGVTIYNYIPLDISILAALAVSLSIVFMHFTNTMHPPGGATALIAVIGSSQVHESKYLFVLSPVATGAVIMLIVALFVNNLSKNTKRHYPKYWF